MVAKAKAKAKAKAVSQPIEVEPDSEDDRDPRLVVPKKTFAGEQEREQYRNWRRGISIWRSQYSKQSEQKLGAKLMEVLLGDAEDIVFATLPSGGESYSAILEVLDSAFGDKGLPEALSALNDFNACVRGKQTLASFIVRFKTLRAKAMKYGLTPSEATDGAILLQKAELTSTQHTGIVQTLRIEAKVQGAEFTTPKYAPTLEALETLAQTLQTQDVAQGRGKRQAVFVAEEQPGAKRARVETLIGNKGKKGDGKGGRGGKADFGGKGGFGGKYNNAGKEQHKWGICTQFSKTGKCSFGDQCKYKHGEGSNAAALKDQQQDQATLLGKGPKGKGKGGAKEKKSNTVCRDFKAGKCSRGASCWFKH